MKKLRTIVTILFLALMLGGMTSCEVGLRTDNGRHRGWNHRHENHDNRENRGKVIIIEKHDRDNRSDNHHDD